MKYLFVFMLLLFICVACSKNNDDNTTVNVTDNYFMQQVSYSNLDEVSAGNIAAMRASNDSVRIFGTMMVSDHTNAQAALDSLGTILHQTLPTTPDSLHQIMATQLQTLSGNIFDTTYIGAQVRDHITTISIFQAELSSGNNHQLLEYAAKYLPVIQMHLQEAQSIQQRIQ
jgi:putative membrane protein